MQKLQRRKGRQWFFLSLLLIFLLVGSPPVWAQETLEGAQPPQPEPAGPLSQNSPFVTSSGLWAAPAGWEPQGQPALSPALAPSAPDNYGYTWDDTLPFAWVDATNGTDTGMNGASSGQHFGPVDLGFSFRYYENTYTQVHIAASGFLTLSESDNWPSQSQIPASSEPNNVIAPYWAPLYLSASGPAGRVYYLRGGTAPSRYFIAEWYDVAGGSPTDSTGGDDLFHFEVILYENGDILFQYDQMSYTGGRWCGSAGIEDAAGTDGLTYLSLCAAAPSGVVVRFSRPAPAARLGISPAYQSGFISPGGVLSWPVSIRNLGDLGPDTFDLTASSTWPVTLLAADGITPLNDTNGNGRADTGLLGPGESLTVTVRVTAPSGIPVGSEDTLTLTAASTLNTAISKTVTLQTAIPARFAQIFRDDADGAMSLLLVQPQGIQRKPASSNTWMGYNPAVAETSAGDLLSIWEKARFSDHNAIVSELEYSLFDHSGNSLRAVTKLTDYSAATQDTYDEEPVVAVALDGSIGIAWQQHLVRDAAGGAQEDWNVFLAILNPNGSLAYGPLNLTQNNAWYQADPATYGVPRFYNVRLAASDDNHFVVTWQRESQEAPAGVCSSNCLLDDIYYTVRDAAGNPLRSVTQLTLDDLSPGNAYAFPAVTRLSGNRWLLAYNHTLGGMAFTVLDSQGNLVRGQAFIGESGWSPVALQLTGGRIILAWTAWTGAVPQIRYVVLDGSTYALIAGPTILDIPAATTGSDFASLAPDVLGHAILTWMDYGWNDRRNLYYTLLDGDGNLVTSPMIFLSAGSTAASPRIQSGFTGYSAAAYRHFVDVPATYWASGWVERLYDSGITAGCTLNPPLYCPEQSVTRAQMAVLLGRAMHGPSYVPPPASGTLFADVPASYWAGSWIEQLHSDGLTAGCMTAPLRYCPEGFLTRAEMAVFLERVTHGSAYVPPPATGIFSDVPASNWAAAWIEQLYWDGLTAGCASAPLRYCPEGYVTRAQTAVFLGRAFNLP
jgi:hypothetical protein